MKIPLIIIGILIIGAAVLLTQKKTTFAPSPAPSPEVINLNNEMNNLNSQDLNSIDNSLNQVSADSSTF